MAKATNPAIGTVRCPWAGCKELAEVRKFQHRATRDTQARFAGKLYAECPEHGRFGGQGGAASQEYILEHATIWGSEREPAPVAAPESGPKPPAASPVKPSPVGTPAPKRAEQTAKKSSGWGTII